VFGTSKKKPLCGSHTFAERVCPGSQASNINKLPSGSIDVCTATNGQLAAEDHSPTTAGSVDPAAATTGACHACAASRSNVFAALPRTGGISRWLAGCGAYTGNPSPSNISATSSTDTRKRPNSVAISAPPLIILASDAESRNERINPLTISRNCNNIGGFVRYGVPKIYCSTM
jgi:hypothetical protein